MSDAPPSERFQECHCTCVTRAQVLTAIAAGCRSVDELRRSTGVCGGCGSCRPELDDLLRSVLGAEGEQEKLRR